MIHPTIAELTQGNFNRYELAIATAKCARIITNKYVCQRDKAEKEIATNKENDKPLTAMIDRELRDEKAVKVAIGRIYNGEYGIVRNQVNDENAYFEKHTSAQDLGSNVLTTPIVIEDDESDEADKNKYAFEDNTDESDDSN